MVGYQRFEIAYNCVKWDSVSGCRHDADCGNQPVHHFCSPLNFLCLYVVYIFVSDWKGL